MIELPSEVTELVCQLRDSLGSICILTGAGISAESGVPTFRDAQTGLWAKYSPEELATPEAFLRDSKLVWDWYSWRRDLVSKAEPNAGHEALAKLEAMWSGEFLLVTQNVDGLHARAGSREIVEVHGSIARTRCHSCRTEAESWDERDDAAPLCHACDGLLRPDVVWFGESLPDAAIQRAFTTAECADLVMSIGTSALVYPIAALPQRALQAGAKVIEINPSVTPLSSAADYSLRASAGAVLPQLLSALS